MKHIVRTLFILGLVPFITYAEGSTLPTDSWFSTKVILDQSTLPKGVFVESVKDKPKLIEVLKRSENKRYVVEVQKDNYSVQIKNTSSTPLILMYKGKALSPYMFADGHTYLKDIPVQASTTFPYLKLENSTARMGYLFTPGKGYESVWYKSTSTDPYTYTDDTGEWGILSADIVKQLDQHRHESMIDVLKSHRPDDDRPKDIAIPEPYDFSVIAYHGDTPVTIKGQIVYSLNMYYKPVNKLYEIGFYDWLYNFFVPPAPGSSFIPPRIGLVLWIVFFVALGILWLTYVRLIRVHKRK